MAKFKTTEKKAAGRQGAAQAEQLRRTLSESAQQVWLAGVGAFSRAQSEGTRLFEALVKEGLSLERNALRFAGGRADVVRGAVESTVGQARERASDTWDRLENVFEDRVQRALTRLGVPSRDDLTDLTRKVDALTDELRRLDGKPAAKKAAKKTTKKTARATRTAPGKTAKTTAKKAARKTTA